jgi:hypothetical protein
MYVEMLMKNNSLKVYKTIFKLSGLKCECGNEIEVTKVQKYNKKYLRLTMHEIIKNNTKVADLIGIYDIENQQLIGPGFYGKDNIKWEIEKYEHENEED